MLRNFNSNTAESSTHSVFKNCTINLAHWHAVSHLKSLKYTTELQRFCRCAKYGKQKALSAPGVWDASNQLFVSASVLNCCHPAQKQSTWLQTVPPMCKWKHFFKPFLSPPYVILPPCITLNWECFLIKSSYPHHWTVPCKTYQSFI